MHITVKLCIYFTEIYIPLLCRSLFPHLTQLYLLIYGLLTAIPDPRNTCRRDGEWIMKWKECGWKRLCPNLRQHSDTYLRKWETTKILSQQIWVICPPPTGRERELCNSTASEGRAGEAWEPSNKKKKFYPTPLGKNPLLWSMTFLWITHTNTVVPHSKHSTSLLKRSRLFSVYCESHRNT